MIATERANSILDTLLRAGSATAGEGATELPKYLGFSSTEPTLNDSGVITNFTEPAASTGYRRIKMNAEHSSALDPAANSSIKNGTYNLAFPVPNKGQQYGSAKAIGFFDTESGGTPYFTAMLTAEQTLGLKTTLVIYKNDFSTTLTATETASA